MGSGKQETIIPAGTQKEANLGGLRVQKYDDGKVHVHDAKETAVFECKKSIRFASSMREFWNRQSTFKVGAVVVVPGDADSPKPGDLQAKMTASGWEFSVTPQGKRNKNAVVIGDGVLSEIYDWAMRNC